MATPTLVIGLGGSGLKAVTHIKKNLLEANQNRLPNEVALMVLDTEREVKYTAGGWGQERSTQHATGPVRIDLGEYIAMVGNVRALGDTIKAEQYEMLRNPAAQRNQPYRHMSGWFQATYYLDVAGLPDQVWNLDEGAGRYRQFGRMAFFRNIDVVEQKLKSSIQAVQRASQGNTLYVHVIGSLAGGTGAALFIDVAHLVQLITRDAGYSQAPVLFGHFVLTEAFRGTRAVKLNESGVLANFNARMYAGLRELTRLQSPIIRRSGGYPLVYDPRGVGTRNSRLEGKPYDAVYLYDGIADRIQLNQRPLENGLAPAIADVVTAYVDDKSGGAFRSHSVNYNAFYSAYSIPPGAVTYGSVGVYTIELPIYHITEGWTHRLARETLDVLLTPDPASFDADTGVPSRLRDNQATGRAADPRTEAGNWVRNNTTSLVGKIAEWGQRAGQGVTTIRDQVVRDILALDAPGWQQELAPTDPQFANYVADAQAVLKGSLIDKASTNYYVELDQGGGSNTERALNLQREIDERLRLMIGETADVWKREGGEFRRALTRLGNHHVAAFESALLKTVGDTLNGAEVGDVIERKRGKLGYIIAFLSELEARLAGGAQTLDLADRHSQAQRRPQFDGIDSARRSYFARLQQGGGLGNKNAKEYRQKSNELAQFQKADIARQVVYGLAARLHKDVGQLLSEARLWETALATAIAADGGAYARIIQGKKEVDSDRQQSQNAVRWVIADDEPGDHYIQGKYTKFADGKVASILEQARWTVGKLDNSGPMRIDFSLGGQPWSREAGQRKAANAGQRNVNQLLALCRAVFDPAWSDMNVTAYLHQNYYGEGRGTLDQLAERVHKNSGYLLDLAPLKTQPGMRTAFVRVYQEGLDTKTEQFLREMRIAVDKRFDVTTAVEQRQNEGQGATQAAYVDDEGKPKFEGYISDRGQPSTDPYKISFLIYGDLLLPDEIKAFGDGQNAYRAFSGADEQWRELQILPADTNALEIERGLESANQRRREFDPDVVTVMEDMGNFQVAMRCLAYGEPDYHWNIGDTTGLLLHEYTPPENNVAGHSYWRLVVMPAGRQGSGGNIYDAAGVGLAQPLEYQLSAMGPEPSLLEAFIQLISHQADINTGNRINWTRVEETIAQAMAWHREQWPSAAAPGWQLKPKMDARLQPELKDKVAQVVRLNALQVSLAEQMAPDAWAWAKGSAKIPEQVAANRGVQARIQIKMDLLSAIRGAAQAEALSLTKRLMQIGVQSGEMPTEKLVISTPFRQPDAVMDAAPAAGPVVDIATPPPTPARQAPPPPPPPDAAPGAWFCVNGHPNRPDEFFCGECGLPRDARPEPEPAAITTAPAAPPPVVASPLDSVLPAPTRPAATPAVPTPIAPAPDVATLDVPTPEAPTPEPEPPTPPAAGSPATAPAGIKCQNGHDMQPGWQFCPTCGALPAAQKKLCLNGHEMQPEWSHCPMCGAGPRS